MLASFARRNWQEGTPAPSRWQELNLYPQYHRVPIIAGSVALITALKVAFPRVILGGLTVLFDVGNHSVDDTTIAGSSMQVRTNITSRRDRELDGYHFILAVELS